MSANDGCFAILFGLVFDARDVLVDRLPDDLRSTAGFQAADASQAIDSLENQLVNGNCKSLHTVKCIKIRDPKRAASRVSSGFVVVPIAGGAST